MCEADSDGILEGGLGFDWCDVAVVTNIGTGDHLGSFDIQTPEQLFTVERCGVDVVLATGAKVLNATDPAVADMATLGRGATIFFAPDAAHPVLAAHRAAGGKHVYVKDGVFMLGEGMTDVPVAAARRRAPDTPEDGSPFQVDNVLAALGAGWALGFSAADMAREPGELCRRRTSPAASTSTSSRRVAASSSTQRAIADALEALIQSLDAFPEQRTNDRVLRGRRPPRGRSGPPRADFG